MKCITIHIVPPFSRCVTHHNHHHSLRGFFRIPGMMYLHQMYYLQLSLDKLNNCGFLALETMCNGQPVARTSRLSTSTAVESSSMAWCKSSRLTFFGIFILIFAAALSAAVALLPFVGTNLRPLYVPTVPPEACSTLLCATEDPASPAANIVIGRWWQQKK